MSPLPDRGWKADSWGWRGESLVLNRKVGFWITCLDHPVDLFPSHVRPGAALGRKGSWCLASTLTPILWSLWL